MRDPIETVLVCEACRVVLDELEVEWRSEHCYCQKCAWALFDWGTPDEEFDE